ncbi:FecCD family ABC transporter permease [Bacillus massiliglaciei]|uniref:FecCD family ABC transporter permease n=1 Tax=Bacillus massiliglaciei TaxID=1816693 RepID=UPI000A43C248|nr:iron ABC transporter permease [Bacillus massiliglaciei]
MNKVNKEKPAPDRKNKIGTAIILFGWIAILLSVIFSIHFGAAHVTYRTVWEGLFFYNSNDPTHVIIHNLRLPRALAAVFVGAALAVAGSLMQGMTRNPLASPEILGVTAGASFFMALAFAFVTGLTQVKLILFSFLGAGFTTAIVFAITAVAKGPNNPVKLALAGAAISSLFTSLSTAVGLKFNVAKEMSFWYAGGVSGIQMDQLKYVIPIIIAGIILSLFLSRSITILSLGDEVSTGLGQNVRVVRTVGMISVLLLTGAAVSIAGTIGFIGLVIPHITRFIVGIDYRYIIPCSAVIGAVFLLFADVIGRMINAPFETPVGAVTALIGVPFFLYLARKEGRGL